jgi:hypothetical protein
MTTQTILLINKKLKPRETVLLNELTEQIQSLEKKGMIFVEITK